jgi:hypothetical protein
MTYFEARYVYDLERQLPNRSFATDHSFGEWCDEHGIRFNGR